MYHICPSKGQTQIGARETSHYERGDPIRQRRTLQFPPSVGGRLGRFDDDRGRFAAAQRLLHRIEAEKQLPCPQSEPEASKHPRRKLGFSHHGKIFIGFQRGLGRPREKSLLDRAQHIVLLGPNPKAAAGQFCLDINHDAGGRIGYKAQKPCLGQYFA